jgi:radical SAM-linked protein
MPAPAPADGKGASDGAWELKLGPGTPGGKSSFRFGDSASSMPDLLFVKAMPGTHTVAETCSGARTSGRGHLSSRFLPPLRRRSTILDFRWKTGNQGVSRFRFATVQDQKSQRPGMVRAKVRIRFRKTGNMRLIGHHDLMRCFERMLRRAALPYHCTQGFNPKPRLVFALPLPLGIEGCQEVAELELDAEISANEVRDRLAQQAPTGIEILDVERIDGRKTAHARLASYRIGVPPDHWNALPGRMAALLSSSSSWVERQRPQRRRIDVRPYLRDLHLQQGALEIDLIVTPTGTARPEEILGLLGLESLLEKGAVLERTRLELDDELADAGVEMQLPACSITQKDLLG